MAKDKSNETPNSANKPKKDETPDSHCKDRDPWSSDGHNNRSNVRNPYPNTGW